MANIKFKDLYFIENIKNRKAFFKALQEINEEGFEINAPMVSLQNINKLEKKQNWNSSFTSKEEVGLTPREFAKSRNLNSSAKKFTNTNAVDLKDYKYWRDDEQKVAPNLNKSFGNQSKNKNADFSSRGKSASLFDELFDDVQDHKSQKKFEKTESVKFFDDLFTDEHQKPDGFKNNKKVNNSSSEIFEDDETKDDFIQKMKDIQNMRENMAKEETQVKTGNNSKTGLKAQVTKKSSKQTSNSSSALKKETKKSSVVKSKTDVKQKSTSSKKTKKKKLDADIKLYKKIRLD